MPEALRIMIAAFVSLRWGLRSVRAQNLPVRDDAFPARDTGLAKEGARRHCLRPCEVIFQHR